MVDIDDRLRSYGTRWREEQPEADVPEVGERPRHVAAVVTLIAVAGLAMGAVVWLQSRGSGGQIAARSAAVLAVRHVVYDDRGLPMECVEAAYPPDTWTFEQQYSMR